MITIGELIDAFKLLIQAIMEFFGSIKTKDDDAGEE